MPSDALPRLTGRTIVITGASTGIGAAAARRLAAAGATVVPVGRSPEKTRAIAAELGAPVLVADFAALDDVRRLAGDLLQHCPRIDVLANNAGATIARRQVTADGHEMTFQVNHLAPFLLTALLRERLEATEGSRVIATSSAGNLVGHVDLDDLESARGRYRSFRVYGTTKLLNILFTRELSRRLHGSATASCFHPGVIASEFGRDSLVAGMLYRTPVNRLMRSPEDGAAPLVALATRADPGTVDGAYLDRFAPGRANRQADDAALASAVWERSAEMVDVPA